MGCADKSRLTHLIKFILKESPDILILLELNGWDRQNFMKLNNFKNETNFPFHSFLNIKTGFNIAILSKKSIDYEEKVLKLFHHGLLKVRISGLTILATHLTPYQQSFRLKEVQEIIGHINSLEKTIIVGDLNSLSPHDNYNEVKLWSFLQKTKSTKFGSKKVSYGPINLLENHNLYDAYLLKNKMFNHSVPTKCNHDKMHFTPLRLDYFFVNSTLKPFIKDVKIIQNSQTDNISDHYPVILCLEKV